MITVERLSKETKGSSELEFPCAPTAIAQNPVQGVHLIISHGQRTF
jgi:hypothetical protein